MLDRIHRLAAGPDRRILGIVGGPGAGKSTLADAIRERTDPHRVAVVGMDGWHLANSTLERLGRLERKGAADTFDAAGYVAFLERFRTDASTTIWAPEYRRSVEEPIGGALEIGPEVTLLVTEGNYLLLDDPPWDRVRPLLDEAWFLAPEEATRRARLVARHEQVGRTHDEALARADGSDAANAAVIASTAARADTTFTDDSVAGILGP
ncbi:MAG TPA: nucleoside/nucleotide kinase family protein [Actinomycetospora sp.]|uniref:nucleoside/nucleotide kinase family protein n=1 Tax=Actinomycetospora sp. TaxID=1872135 RepID=UPI002F400D27